MQDQTLSSETRSSELDPQSYFTSGLDTASLLSLDAQTAFLLGNIFSEVIIPNPVPAHIRLPEYYTAEDSPSPTPNFETIQLELTELLYTIQHAIPFSNTYRTFLQRTIYYRTEEKKQHLKHSKLLI